MTTPQRILITGSNGCAGSHLSELALSHGCKVYGLDRGGDFVSGVVGRLGDVSCLRDLEDVISDSAPDWIFHLAALIPHAKPALAEDFIATNVTGTYYLLDVCRRFAPAARVLVSISSSVYGKPTDPHVPISTDAPLCPRSLYATTKAAQDLLAHQFFLQHGVDTVRVRTFNQTGPREPANLVCATLARQIAQIEIGAQDPPVRAITLEPRRDFVDVRDVVKGYWAALRHGDPGEAYNICSGCATPIREIADILVGFSICPELEVIEGGPAPDAPAILGQVGDPGALVACSGWRPVIPLEQSLRDLLDEWRAKVAALASEVR